MCASLSPSSLSTCLLSEQNMRKNCLLRKGYLKWVYSQIVINLCSSKLCTLTDWCCYTSITIKVSWHPWQLQKSVLYRLQHMCYTTQLKQSNYSERLLKVEHPHKYTECTWRQNIISAFTHQWVVLMSWCISHKYSKENRTHFAAEICIEVSLSFTPLSSFASEKKNTIHGSLMDYNIK